MLSMFRIPISRSTVGVRPLSRGVLRLGLASQTFSARASLFRPAPAPVVRSLHVSSGPKDKQLPRMSAEEYRQLRDEYHRKHDSYKTQTTINYCVSFMLFFLTLSFASVPIYRAICQRTGWGGVPITDQTKFTSDKMVPVDTDKRIRVQFTAETARALPWKFVPQQREVYVAPGETALAFYKAKNNSKNDITGMATYSVTPDNVAPYFNKIQCFCFEEQRLNAGEEVDMPLFFFIDPEFAEDPAMRNIDDIVLHYTFFRATHDAEHDRIIREAQEKMTKANEAATKGAVDEALSVK